MNQKTDQLTQPISLLYCPTMTDNSHPEYSVHAGTATEERMGLIGVLQNRIGADRLLCVVDQIQTLIKYKRTHGCDNPKYDFSKTDDIERYCLDRLEEIRVINEVFHVPSGFVCIAAFIGFLSSLAYGRNKKSGEDHSCFTRFVKKFMTNYDEEKMYSTFRCGIVHAMSFYPAYERGRSSDNPTQPLAPPAYSITHSATWKNLATSTTNGIGLGIQASALCNDIEDAIKDMFDNPANQSERDNAIKTLAWQPAIAGKQVDPITNTQLSD